jgi:hypothetical protein
MDPPGRWLRYAKRYCRLPARLTCSLAATGLADADAYDELAALLLEGIRTRSSRAL